MKPTIEATDWGSITINNTKYEHDVVIRLDGTVMKRHKNLSRAKYGTSHKISLEEAIDVYDTDAKLLIIGTGQTDKVKLSKKAAQLFDEQKCKVQLLSTPKAIKAWNEASGKVIGMFHVTC